MELVILNIRTLEVKEHSLINEDFEIVVDSVIYQKSKFNVNKSTINAEIGDVVFVKGLPFFYLGIICGISNEETSKTNIEVNDFSSIFDVQVKRLHEYKRQLLNVLKIITLYNTLVENPNADITPQTYIFGAKAAPGYYHAKEVIELINYIAKDISMHPEIKAKLNVAESANAQRSAGITAWNQEEAARAQRNRVAGAQNQQSAVRAELLGDAQADMIDATTNQSIANSLKGMVRELRTEDLYNTADTIVAGRCEGSDALAAIGATSYLHNMMVCLLMIRVWR